MIIHKVRISNKQIQKVVTGSFLKPLKLDRQDGIMTLWYMTDLHKYTKTYYLLKVYTGKEFYFDEDYTHVGTYEDVLVYHVFLLQDNERTAEIYRVLEGNDYAS